MRVGNQDSLQRGLRPCGSLGRCPRGAPKLETRTRFKEDCDARAVERPTTSSNSFPCWKPGLASKRIATLVAPQGLQPLGQQVGNQDSLQRGLRRERSHTYKICFTLLLETRTRFKEDCDSDRKVESTAHHRWKPGLASKRIATWGIPLPTAWRHDGWKPGLASKRIATSRITAA